MAITAPISVIERSDTYARSTRSPSGLDRLVARVGVALLAWADARAARTAQTHDVIAHQVQLRAMAQQRELDALRLTQRMGY